MSKIDISKYINDDLHPEVPVVITTEHKGVFFGYTTNVKANPITLRRMRNCLSWTDDMKGFIGLAKVGPSASCRIGPEAEAPVVRAVALVLQCTDAAAAAWERAPWDGK